MIGPDPDHIMNTDSDPTFLEKCGYGSDLNVTKKGKSYIIFLINKSDPKYLEKGDHDPQRCLNK